LHKVLDAARARYADDVTDALDQVLKVEGASLHVELQGKAKSFSDFVEDADEAVIEDAYRRACRALSADVSRTYAEYLAAKETDADSAEEALLAAHANIAALGLVPDVKEYLDTEADKLAKSWLDEYRVAIKGLSDERQEAYRQIKEMSTEPQDIDLTKPKSWMAPTFAREANGEEHPLPTREHHLLCDADGEFPINLNDLEEDVLDRELSRTGFLAWYRNPSSASQESLAIAYQDGTTTKMVRPDFVFFSERADGSVGAVIVDPHGYHFADALPKLRGLANYAATHGAVYQRIEAVAKVGDKLRVLDLTSANVRKAVEGAADAKALYEGSHASDY
jgi:type III restriction enzyme